MDNASSLAKVIHEAPRLLELLSPDPQQPLLAVSAGCLLPLLGTNSHLRQAVHSLVTGLYLQRHSDVPVFAKCSWQNLQKLSLINCASNMVQLAQAHLPLLTSLNLSENLLSTVSIAYLTRHTGLCCNRYASTRVKWMQLASGCRPTITGLI